MTRREQKLRYYYANREEILRKKREKRREPSTRAKEAAARQRWREDNKYAEKLAWVYGIKIGEARQVMGADR